MKTQDVLDRFGTATAVARELGVSKQAVSQWGELVPPASAALLEKITAGALVFDPNSYVRRRGRLWAPTEERV